MVALSPSLPPLNRCHQVSPPAAPPRECRHAKDVPEIVAVAGPLHEVDGALAGEAQDDVEGQQDGDAQQDAAGEHEACEVDSRVVLAVLNLAQPHELDAHPGHGCGVQRAHPDADEEPDATVLVLTLRSPSILTS